MPVRIVKWSKMSRTATAVLSTENLIHNVQVIKKLIGSACIIAMVKANAYGHGIRSVSKRLEPYVDMFGVASIDEALALRAVGINSPIVLMEGVFEFEELVIAADQNFHVVFHSMQQIEWLRLAELSRPLHVWVKINTGMGRLGFSVEQGHQILSMLETMDSIIRPIGIMSHFGCADISDHVLNNQQMSAFGKYHDRYPQSIFSFCNSAALFSFANQQYDFVRPGLALYGISPFDNVSTESLGLKPVMTLRSSLIAVSYMKKGASVGYGARYVCPESMLIGVVAFGYGDGYPITARDGTPVLVNGIRCPLIGRISMDMMTVDLRNCPMAKIGDQVLLWGEGLSIQEVAKHVDGHVWSLLTGIQNRVTFQWTK